MGLQRRTLQHAPKALIVNAILSAVYATNPDLEPVYGDYFLPENLERFFAGLDRQTV